MSGLGPNPSLYANLSFMEEIYKKYLKDPNLIEPSWRYFFEGIDFAGKIGEGRGKKEGELSIFQLIHAYRTYGHLGANTNPLLLSSKKTDEVEELKLERFGLGKEDLEKEVSTFGFFPEEKLPLSRLLEGFRKTYLTTVGFEYMGIQSSELEKWIQKRIEPDFSPQLSKQEKKELLYQLNKSEIFESFVHMKYPGQKRFSIEGGETLVPMIQEIIEEGGEKGIGKIVLGMTHRGRLNVLANVTGKPYKEIFQEFEGGFIPTSFEGSGDVKYHMGYRADVETKKGKKVHLTICANPSHLESVDPVVEGLARAKQERGKKRGEVLPLLIHGDASVAGQGVVYETIQLSKLFGYGTGGTLHIVVNNQVGFTASPEESKSTRYCTDLAKTFGAPIFHLNAEDPERCIAATKLALEIRQLFKCDVFLELICYRKYGHNETDEPSFTHPLMAKMIKAKRKIRDLYKEQLCAEGHLTHEEGEALEKEFVDSLETALSETKMLLQKEGAFPRAERDLSALLAPVATAVPLEKLRFLASRFCRVQEGFSLHPKLHRILEERLKMIEGEKGGSHLDWGMAESLAYASLLTEKIPVRISGQDSGRGTFSHRHAILTDQETEQRYMPLSHLEEGQAPFAVYNSPLSEYAVMGFEYGYGLEMQEALLIWEAQFGDFANGAQIIIDQYIVSSEQKWGQSSRITLFLPHGYEGQGPEHSSARLERFLQLAANASLNIVIPSTAAQFFHSLRRQGLRKIRKPLILFTPKALLRYPPSLSPPVALSEGCFEEVLDDPSSPKHPKELFFCSGRVYYDLFDEREK
ncbi:MAG: 2-oxoglutarate dehydrogenase E1 component, partial [Simkania negevensis]|nr:2-oxoglutarate dehydrogenase E1 component [Simkania negevensis]